MNKNSSQNNTKNASLHWRRMSREIALQALYQQDLRGNQTSVNEEFLKKNAFLESEETRLSAQGSAFKEDPSVWQYALTLVNGTILHWDEINKKIQEIAQNWSLTRMAVVDRSILRMAIYELLYQKDVPSSVVINEAIEIAKNFSTNQSGSFINGILDKMIQPK